MVLALFRFTFVRTKVNPGVGAGEAPLTGTRGPGPRSAPLRSRPATGESALRHRLQQPLLPKRHIVIICHNDVVRQADMHRLQGLFDL